MHYELFCLIGASREAELENIRKDVIEIIASNEGVFEEKETQEKRRLAYRIKHETHGIYIAQRFSMEPEKLANISKRFNLYPSLLRFIISKTDELPELKSKEERIREANAQSERKAKIPAEPKREKPAEKSKEEFKSEDRKEKESPKEDEIDKKLEEILNI